MERSVSQHAALDLTFEWTPLTAKALQIQFRAWKSIPPWKVEDQTPRSHPYVQGVVQIDGYLSFGGVPCAFYGPAKLAETHLIGDYVYATAWALFSQNGRTPTFAPPKQETL